MGSRLLGVRRGPLGRWGRGHALAARAADASPEAAIEGVLKLTGDQLVDAWHAELRATYRPLLGSGESADARAQLLVGETRLGGDVNVGPAISPDGRWIAFLSERGLCSVDLFIADTATGQVTKRVTSTAFDQHLSSLQFIASSGSCDADSRRPVFTALGDGKPRLVVFDITNGHNSHEIRLDELDDVFTRTWSPDGRAVAIAALVGGFTDLFVYNIADSTLRRLTHDSMPFSNQRGRLMDDELRLRLTASPPMFGRLRPAHTGWQRLTSRRTIAQCEGSTKASTSTRSGSRVAKGSTFSCRGLSGRSRTADRVPDRIPHADVDEQTRTTAYSLLTQRALSGDEQPIAAWQFPSRTVERGPRIRHGDHGCDESYRRAAVSLRSGAHRASNR
jgi:hypothetical protein